ncbi:MAG: hypothetical protein RMY29_004765 [Nostoc sp. CreGUA01]|nr:hypothetical protein [Nostoc sp. CreGUA01]
MTKIVIIINNVTYLEKLWVAEFRSQESELGSKTGLIADKSISKE